MLINKDLKRFEKKGEMRSWYFTENLCLWEKVWMSLQAIEASSTTELCFNNPIDLSCIPICCQHAHTFTKFTCETSFCPSFLFTIPLTSCWSLARMHSWRWSRRNQGAHLGTLASLKDIKDPCLTAWGDFVHESVFAYVVWRSNHLDFESDVHCFDKEKLGH